MAPAVGLSSLFPQRLKQKVPFWSTARGDWKCACCGDDVCHGETIVVDPATRDVFCTRRPCGKDYMASKGGNTIQPAITRSPEPRREFRTQGRKDNGPFGMYSDYDEKHPEGHDAFKTFWHSRASAG